MTNPKTSKKVTNSIDLLRPEDYAREIINRFQNISAISGNRPSLIFDQWLELVDASLEALPEQLKALALTGRFAPDPPDVAELFERVRASYDDERLGPDRCRRVWQNFGEAFAYLLASAAPGLWGQADYGPIGPDLIGHVYESYADPSWQSQYMTPWPVATLMARLTIQDGAAQVHQRLKQALTHPDNHLGAAVLMASLATAEDEADQAWDWFINRVIPSAMPFYEPILFQEPAIGSGRLMLGAAIQFPEWAVVRGLVRFTGQDVDLTCVRMSRINAKLYGLNGYALKLTAAVAEALEARQVNEQPPLSLPQALEKIRQVNKHPEPPTTTAGDRLSFEQLFRTAVGETVSVDR